MEHFYCRVFLLSFSSLTWAERKVSQERFLNISFIPPSPTFIPPHLLEAVGACHGGRYFILIRTLIKMLRGVLVWWSLIISLPKPIPIIKRNLSSGAQALLEVPYRLHLSLWTTRTSPAWNITWRPTETLIFGFSLRSLIWRRRRSAEQIMSCCQELLNCLGSMKQPPQSQDSSVGKIFQDHSQAGTTSCILGLKATTWRTGKAFLPHGKKFHHLVW